MGSSTYVVTLKYCPKVDMLTVSFNFDKDSHPEVALKIQIYLEMMWLTGRKINPAVCSGKFNFPASLNFAALSSHSSNGTFEGDLSSAESVVEPEKGVSAI